jgi:hypothetical protein
MEERQSLPNGNQLSVLVSTILLAYAITPFVSLEPRFLNLRIGNSLFTFPLNFIELISILVAILAALGTDWLIRNHPYLGNESTWQHVILPGLTAWVIGVPLSSLQESPEWWAVFGFGGVLLLLVVVAEYITVDLSDARHTPAVVVLTAASFALYLVVAIVIRTAQTRLYLQLPALVITMALVALRTLFFRLGGRWLYSWAIGIALFVGQMAVGLHYLPLSPLAFGLVLLGPAYALTSLAGSMEEGRSIRTAWVEPAVMLVVLWFFAWVLG